MRFICARAAVLWGESEVSLGLHAVKAQAKQPCFAALVHLRRLDPAENKTLRFSRFRNQNRQKVPPEISSVLLLCILAAKTNTRRRVSIK